MRHHVVLHSSFIPGGHFGGRNELEIIHPLPKPIHLGNQRMEQTLYVKGSHSDIQPHNLGRDGWKDIEIISVDPRHRGWENEEQTRVVIRRAEAWEDAWKPQNIGRS